MLVQLYKQTLNQPNITYIVKEIKEKNFKKLDLLILQIEKILDISKIIIFVDKIENGVKMA